MLIILVLTVTTHTGADGEYCPCPERSNGKPGATAEKEQNKITVINGGGEGGKRTGEGSPDEKVDSQGAKGEAVNGQPYGHPSIRPSKGKFFQIE